jgi:hypothetical protein
MNATVMAVNFTLDASNSEAHPLDMAVVFVSPRENAGSRVVTTWQVISYAF